MAKAFFVIASPLRHVSQIGVPSQQLKHKTLHTLIICFSQTQPYTYYMNTIVYIVYEVVVTYVTTTLFYYVLIYQCS